MTDRQPSDGLVVFAVSLGMGLVLGAAIMWALITWQGSPNTDGRAFCEGATAGYLGAVATALGQPMPSAASYREAVQPCLDDDYGKTLRDAMASRGWIE